VKKEQKQLLQKIEVGFYKPLHAHIVQSSCTNEGLRHIHHCERAGKRLAAAAKSLGCLRHVLAIV
jgi:hypothetical protein